MRREEAGCYLEINLATGNIDRIATDPGRMAEHFRSRGVKVRINEVCGGFCQHALGTCLRIADPQPAE